MACGNLCREASQVMAATEPGFENLPWCALRPDVHMLAKARKAIPCAADGFATLNYARVVLAIFASSAHCSLYKVLVSTLWDLPYGAGAAHSYVLLAVVNNH